MTMLATCPVHGRFQVQNLFGGVRLRNVEIRNMVLPCPRCGLSSRVDDGVYSTIGSVVRALRADGVTFDEVLRFRKFAEQVDSGKLSSSDASNQVEDFAPAIQALWKWVNENGQALSLLIAIIALYIAISSSISDDKTAAEQLEATRVQTEVLQQQVAEASIQTEMIATIAEKMSPEVPPAPIPIARPGRVPATAATAPNRHERRKAASKAKRNRGGNDDRH